MSKFTSQEKKILLEIVTTTIKIGLTQKRPPLLDLALYPEKLQERGASFVTLKYKGQLRGCIGTLEVYQALAQDVANNAYSAAFRDPRFAPLTAVEYPHTTQQISILSAPIPILFNSEEDLLRQLRPGIDGLILSERACRGTFLPAVWEDLPQPAMFLQHLKMKAGLTPNYWSNTLQVERYTVETVT